MKKLVKIGTSLILLVQSILLAWPVQPVQGQDQIGQDFEFFLDPPLVGDQSITGEALPNHPISLEVQDQEFETLVEEDGQFEFDPIPGLREEDDILVKQGENELKSPVFTEDQAPDRVEFEGDFNFEGLVDLDEAEDLDPDADQAGEQESDVEEETEDEAQDKSEAGSDPEGSDRSVGEEGEDPENSEDEASASDEEEEVETEDDSEDADATGDPGDEEVDEEAEDEENAEEGDQPIGQSRAAAPPSQAPGPTSSSAAVAQVSNLTELIRAMENPNIEIVRLTSDISGSSGARPNMRVDSNSRRKILDGQGFSLHINQAAGFDTGTRIDDMVVKNFSNIYTRHSDNDEGFMRMRSNPYNFHLEDVTFNDDNLPDGAHLFSAWESTIHFYGQINVNTPPSRDFITRTRLAHFHDGAQVVLRSNGIGLQQLDQGNVRNLPKGIVVGDGVNLTIKSKDAALHNTFAGAGPIQLEIGTNSNVNLESIDNDAINIEGTSNFNMEVAPGSRLNLFSERWSGLSGTNNNADQVFNLDIRGHLDIEANRGLYFRRQAFNFTLREGAKATIQGGESAVYQYNAINRNRPQFNVYPQASWEASSQNGDTFRLLGQSDFNIQAPESVDFRAEQPDTLTISRDTSHRFRISNLLMRSWTENINNLYAGVQTRQFDQGSFTLTPDSFTDVNMTPSSSVFPREFPRTMRRWQFIAGLDDPKVDEPVYDTSTEITGQAQANSEVVILDDDSEVIAATDTDSNGRFKFELDQPFPVGTTLTFQARRGSVRSGWVDVEVQGNRLELFSVDDLVFQTTEIKDQANQVIPKTQPVQAQVLDTRPEGSWQLTAQALSPLTNQTGYQLPNALYYYSNSTNNFQLLEGQAVQVASDQSPNLEGVGDYLRQVTWAEEEGFLIRTNPIYAQSESQYTSRIQWTLKDAP
ncbi:Uncharacterised protein [Alloiococcus otitis]|uniref:Bacterial Ig domain-containing protein n=1 Tax=Alloiococcus otitis ATCC 51267 TaxID=883081 RepID=K9ERR2_9LACT|nr:Ig-like domain-containing protein [Alloiococcus otitis]EKU93642.1 hypothetical protein HMPREF9698_00759 [Alloiococcus otitis ATCC 51267]SUU80239.1 Uncharacterised protein [Alloiococcus otitis]